MSIPARTPVLVGCAQLSLPTDDLDPNEAAALVEPLAMMERVARAAADDAGAPGLLGRIDSIRIPHGVWRYSNPAFQLGQRLGCGPVETAIAPINGASVQIMLSRGALDVQSGRRDVVLLASAECEHWRRRAKRDRAALPAWADFGAFDPQEGAEGIPAPDQQFGADQDQIGWWEKQYRVQALQGFALYENALRYASGAAPAEHRERIVALWARFAQIAADNPHAWIRDAPTAAQIGEASADNRMVSYPYTKRMAANISVNQAAALLLCSYEAARGAGVPDDRMVFPHASAEAARTHEISLRPDLHSQPAIGLVGQRAFALAGAAAQEIEHVDLYSCFPAAVQIGAAELGLPLERDLTLTGGLTFSGGPLNSYVMHSTAATIARLRERRAAGHTERALVSSVGGFVAKHAVAIYGAEPREHHAFRHESVDDEAAALPRRALRADFEGAAQVESFAVMSGRGGEPSHLLLSCGLEGGARAWAECADPAVLAAVEREEVCGRPVRIGASGRAEFV